jgi:HAD superfamily hydrolase (TIGR01549 family)
VVNVIKGIIFDIDGTLVTLKVDAARLRATMIKELEILGFDTSALNLSSSTQSIIEHAVRQIEFGQLKMSVKLLKARLYSILDKLEFEWNSECLPIDGADKVLKALNDSSLRLGIVTNSGRNSANFLLHKYDFAKYFEFILTRNDVNEMKPKPDGILMALELLNLPKDRVIYIGDSAIDVRAAKAAGVKIASVISGHYSEDKLRTEGSDYVLRSVADLPKIIK